MRVVTIALLTFLCAASTACDPHCQIIAGKYSFTATVSSGTCPLGLPTPAGWEPLTSSNSFVDFDVLLVNGPELYQVAFHTSSALGSDASRPRESEECSIDVSFDDLRVSDAIHDDLVELDIAFEFHTGGFTATETVNMPPAVSLPSGCDGVLILTGTLE